jgi:LysR substrate binding domain-containing protein
MALKGVGITVVNDSFALPYLQRGELVAVLPDWHLPPVHAWAVFPGRRLMPARTRVFLDAVVAKFSGPECQAIEAAIQKTKTQLRESRPAAAAVKSRATTSKRDVGVSR